MFKQGYEQCPFITAKLEKKSLNHGILNRVLGRVLIQMWVISPRMTTAPDSHNKS